jgi:hypothetical protein
VLSVSDRVLVEVLIWLSAANFALAILQELVRQKTRRLERRAAEMRALRPPKPAKPILMSVEMDNRQAMAAIAELRVATEAAVAGFERLNEVRGRSH